MITEEWQADIAARDYLDVPTLISKIANLLYPEMIMAADRERRLFEEGGEIIQRIQAATTKRAKKLDGMLKQYDRRQAVQV